MTQKKYEYNIQGKTFKLEKLVMGAIFDYENATKDGINKENFPKIISAIFYEQDTSGIDWNKLDPVLYAQIMNDFFFLNKKIIIGQQNLAKNILSVVMEQNSQAK